MTGLAPSRVEIQARLEEALAGRVPVAVATVVRGGQIGAKLLILPDETLGGLGDATLDAAVTADVPDLLDHERSETRPYQVAGREERIGHLLHGAEGTGETVVMSSTKAIQTYREAEPTGADGLPQVNSQSSGSGGN